MKIVSLRKNVVISFGVILFDMKSLRTSGSNVAISNSVETGTLFRNFWQIIWGITLSKYVTVSGIGCTATQSTPLSTTRVTRQGLWHCELINKERAASSRGKAWTKQLVTHASPRGGEVTQLLHLRLIADWHTLRKQAAITPTDVLLSTFGLLVREPRWEIIIDMAAHMAAVWQNL